MARYPKSNGVVLSEAVAIAAFKRAGFAIDLDEFPAKRLATSLQEDNIDSFISSEASIGELGENFLRSELPLTRLAYYIYFDGKKDWQPQWPPDVEFIGKIGRSRSSSTSLKDYDKLNVALANSYESCVKMVNSGRADYWLDNVTGSRTLTPGLMLEKEGFVYRYLFSRSIYLYFQNTERGQQLKKIFDQGYLDILQSREFLQIYYGDMDGDLSSTTGFELIEYLRNEHPELGVPEQLPIN